MRFRKITAVLLSIALSLPAFTILTANAALGDLNNDGTANASDAAALLIEAARLGSTGRSTFTAAQRTAADIDSDGTVNASDAANILVYAASVGSGIFKGTMQNYADRCIAPKKQLATLGKIIYWEYHDYDGNHTSEAFAVVSLGGRDEYSSVYFISDSGTTVCVDAAYPSTYHDYASNDYARFDAYQNKGFFSYDKTGGGSGYSTFLYSVRSGVPYELDISGELQGFYLKDGYFCTTQNDFSKGYHQYPEYRLNYNAQTQQFTLGQKLSDNTAV